LESGNTTKGEKGPSVGTLPFFKRALKVNLKIPELENTRAYV
jgi:hypothetical protein